MVVLEKIEGIRPGLLQPDMLTLTVAYFGPVPVYHDIIGPTSNNNFSFSS